MQNLLRKVYEKILLLTPAIFRGDYQSTGDKIPDRLVRLTGLRYQEVDDQRFRFLLNNAIPKSVMDGNPKEGYVIRQYPSVLETKGPNSVN
jgi:hypothetical protein